VVGLGVLIAGASQVANDPAGEEGAGLVVTGLVVVLANGVWSIFSAIKDAENYNRRAAGGRDGASLELRPVFRVLAAGGMPLDGAAPRAGLEVGRVTF
jgi:hypothetical protein